MYLFLTQVLCLFGYSWSGLVIAMLLCIIPLGWLQWVCLLYGLANSVVFVVCSLRSRVDRVVEVVLWVSLTVVALVMLLCLKWVFLQPPSPATVDLQ